MVPEHYGTHVTLKLKNHVVCIPTVQHMEGYINLMHRAKKEESHGKPPASHVGYSQEIRISFCRSHMPASIFSLFLFPEMLFLFLQHHGPIFFVFTNHFYVFKAPDHIITTSTRRSQSVSIPNIGARRCATFDDVS